VGKPDVKVTVPKLILLSAGLLASRQGVSPLPALCAGRSLPRLPSANQYVTLAVCYLSAQARDCWTVRR